MRASLLLAALPLVARDVGKSSFVAGSSFPAGFKLGQLTHDELIVGDEMNSKLTIEDIREMDRNWTLVDLPIRKIPKGVTIRVTLDPPDAEQPVQEPDNDLGKDSPGDDFIQTALRLHNDVRGEHKLVWDHDLYQESLQWAKKCIDAHSGNQPQRGATRSAENIVPVVCDLDFGPVSALEESFRMWYWEEVRYYDPREPGVVQQQRNLSMPIESGDVDSRRPHTIGHAANILDSRLTKFAVAMHFCDGVPAPGTYINMDRPLGYWSVVTQFNG